MLDRDGGKAREKQAESVSERDTKRGRGGRETTQNAGGVAVKMRESF